jgi:hypothetical protein
MRWARLKKIDSKITRMIKLYKSAWILGENHDEDFWQDLAKRLRKTRKFKSDSYSGNPRKYWGEITLQEKRSEDSFHDQLNDLEQ